QNAWMNVAERLRMEASRGDTAASRRLVQAALREQWKPYVVQLERRRRALTALGRESDAATGAQRLAVESDMTRLTDRILESYQGLVDVVLALGRGGVAVAEQRAYLTRGLHD